MTDPALMRALGALPAIRERLSAWVRCASVSADPAYREGMERARRFIERRISEAGFLNIRRLDAGGHPAVFAEWLDAPGRPTILVYGHYDVQPPDPLGLWHAPPFEPTEREGRLYGRGVADDKGPCLVALEALAALLAEEGRLPVNVKLLIEGEEELGSRTLERLLTEHYELLSADAVLSADGARWRPDLPTINVASRGIGGLEVTLRTAGKDLHSGRYGGVVRNALHVLADILGSLHGPAGQVAVPGFYDGVAEPSVDERNELAGIPFDAADWLAPVGASEFGEAGYTTLERLWLRPCLDVNGMWGGYQGTGAKTVIPAEAHAKLSVRLVPGQDPRWIEQALRTHLLAKCPASAQMNVTSHTGWSSAHAVPPDHPLLLAAEAALEETGGTRPLRIRIGASLPLTDIVARVLGVDVVMFSFATADEDFHAPNEFFRLSAVPEGLTAWISLLRHLGGHSQDDYSAFRGGC